ncbi:MAG: hypothetical protein E7666_06745 [Ruminococcaceae bacterium]|nr:hypothetical protein [Oscillospiraceae bacterium]
MKVTQYITNDSLQFATRPIFRSTKMSGALTLRETGTVVSDDFLGFGVAITGSSCYELSLMEPERRRALIEEVYGKNGIGLSIARLSVASSDYSAELYSYDDVENDTALTHFSIDRDRAYIIPMIREILAVNPDLFLYASPWSPPGWMKTGGNMCGGYMRAEYIECYADYIVKFLEEYAKCGIKIAALTPQNEPETQQHGQMPACIWHPDIEAAYISVLRRKLRERGMDVQIWMFDQNLDNYLRVNWMLDTYSQLRKDCDGAAFHYYRGSIEQTRAVREKYPEIKIHFTEGGPRLYDHYDTDWCKWGLTVSRALNEGLSSFTGWNLMLDETGGPNIGPYFCGGLIMRNSISGDLSYSGQFKAFRHVAKFMKKGAKVLELLIDDNTYGTYRFPKEDAPLQASLIENPDGSRAYLLINRDSTKRQVQFFEGGTWWYVEMLPNTVSTVVVEV